MSFLAFQGILYQALHDEGVTKHIGYYLTLEEASIKEIEDGVFNELPSLEVSFSGIKSIIRNNTGTILYSTVFEYKALNILMFDSII